MALMLTSVRSSQLNDAFVALSEKLETALQRFQSFSSAPLNTNQSQLIGPCRECTPIGFLLSPLERDPMLVLHKFCFLTPLCYQETRLNRCKSRPQQLQPGSAQSTEHHRKQSCPT